MRAYALVVVGVATLLSSLPAQAARVVDRPDLRLDVGGDIKAFFNLSDPYEHFFMPEGLQPSAALDFRFRFSGAYNRWLSWEFHHSATMRYATEGAAMLGESLSTSPGAGSEDPFAWTAHDEEGFAVFGRVDRMSLAFHGAGVDVRFGRQPISFGSGYFFTPLDLLSPYAPQVVDREYKPGVDAVRFDLYFGMSGRLTGVVARTRPEDPDGFTVIGNGGFTAGLFDLDFFVAKHYRDMILGFSTKGSAGPVGLHGDLSLVVPFTGESPSESGEPTQFRLVVGADGRSAKGTAVMAELYVQSFGSDDSKGYLRAAADSRVMRGDYWTLGHVYAALSITQEITPVFFVGGVTIANLADPSALVGPSLTWSIASGVDLAAGGFIAVGKRPPTVDLMSFFGEDGLPLSQDQILENLDSASEFGLLPHQAYVQLKVYF